MDVCSNIVCHVKYSVTGVGIWLDDLWDQLTLFNYCRHTILFMAFGASPSLLLISSDLIFSIRCFHKWIITNNKFMVSYGGCLWYYLALKTSSMVTILFEMTTSLAISAAIYLRCY